MSLDRVISAAERLMSMDDRTWARHANPWSVWTRVATPLPLLALAIWSRVWIGGWAWGAVAVVILWIWLNPRVFPKPRHLDSWAARGVMGERVFLRHGNRVSKGHRRAAAVLSTVSALGILPFAWGLWRLEFWAVVAGMVLITGGKLWFVDRMVWIWDEFMRDGGTVRDLDSN